MRIRQVLEETVCIHIQSTITILLKMGGTDV